MPEFGAFAPSVRFEEHYGGGVVRLTSPHGSVVIALKGGQGLSWVRAHSEEVFWLSPVADLVAQKPVRGGIPICWPWFGAHPTVAGAPSHGFARTAAWEVVPARSEPGSPIQKLALDVEAGSRSDWPHAAHAEVTVRLGRSLVVELLTINTGAQAFALTQTLHSYFRVGDIGEATIKGLEGRPFIDQLRNGAQRRDGEAIQIAAEIDRIYQDTPDAAVIFDTILKRRITVAKQGSRSGSATWGRTAIATCCASKRRTPGKTW